MQRGPKPAVAAQHQIDLIFAPHYRGNKAGSEAAWLFVQPLATVPFLTFSVQLQIAFGRTPNHDPFALESSFTLSSTDVRRFRYRGIEAYV